MRSLIASIVALLILVIVAFQSFFVVDERQKVVVTRLSTLQASINEPGLHFKIPFIDRIYKFDDRLLVLDSDEFDVFFSDSRRLLVDAFSRWRIGDVNTFFLANDGSQAQARDKLSTKLEDALKGVLGKVDTSVILSPDRTVLMREILAAVRAEAIPLGIDVVDVSIVRSDLPPANLEKTFERMSAERQKEVADEVARGEEAAKRITSRAEREAVQIESNAKRQNEIIKGEADAERSKIYADVYSKDPEFFDFYRSMQAYEQTMKNTNTSMVLSPDSDFFRYLQNEGGAQ